MNERAIPVAKNKDAHELNFKIQDKNAEMRTYKSVQVTNDDDVMNYPPKLLNSLDLPEVPLYILQLKCGSVVIMFLITNLPKLGNGTRLAIRNY